MAEKKVLLVDDDPDITLATQIVLEAHDYQMIAAPNGAAGFEKARQEKPDVILLDVMIEDAGTGLDIARKLRDDQVTAHIPVILMTSIRRADQLLSSYAPDEPWPNVKGALEKPVEPEVLIKTIKKATKDV